MDETMQLSIHITGKVYVGKVFRIKDLKATLSAIFLGQRSFATSHPDYVPSIFPKKPISPTPTKKAKAVKSKKPKVESPHRQKLERSQRRVARQSKPKKGMIL